VNDSKCKTPRTNAVVSCHQARPITHVEGKAIIVNLNPPNRAEMEVEVEMEMELEMESLHMTS